MAAIIDLFSQTISLIKGDTTIFEIEVIDDDNYGYDLTTIDDVVGYFTIKEEIDDEDASKVLQKSLYTHDNTDLNNGVIHFKFEPADTSALEAKKYFFDISIESSSDSTIKYTILRGDLYLIKDIKNT